MYRVCVCARACVRVCVQSLKLRSDIKQFLTIISKCLTKYDFVRTSVRAIKNAIYPLPKRLTLNGTTRKALRYLLKTGKIGKLILILPLYVHNTGVWLRLACLESKTSWLHDCPREVSKQVRRNVIISDMHSA